MGGGALRREDEDGAELSPVYEIVVRAVPKPVVDAKGNTTMEVSRARFAGSPIDGVASCRSLRISENAVIVKPDSELSEDDAKMLRESVALYEKILEEATRKMKIAEEVRTMSASSFGGGARRD